MCGVKKKLLQMAVLTFWHLHTRPSVWGLFRLACPQHLCNWPMERKWHHQVSWALSLEPRKSSRYKLLSKGKDVFPMSPFFSTFAFFLFPAGISYKHFPPNLCSFCANTCDYFRYLPWGFSLNYEGVRGEKQTLGELYTIWSKCVEE